MWFQLISFLKYQLKARGLGALHSPHLFELGERVLYNEHHFYAYRALDRMRNRLLQDLSTIEVKDLGAGSKKLGAKRVVADIVKTSGSPEKFNRLLLRTSWFLQPNHVLELGTSLGMGTAALALGKSESRVTSVEGDPSTYRKAVAALKEAGIKNTELINSSFDDALEHLDERQWDLVFVDGHHEEAATIRYAERLLGKMNPNSVIILDDIHWSSGMQNAWEHLKKDERVTYSIDLYRMGILGLREGMETQQHFTLRY